MYFRPISFLSFQCESYKKIIWELAIFICAHKYKDWIIDSGGWKLIFISLICLPPPHIQGIFSFSEILPRKRFRNKVMKESCKAKIFKWIFSFFVCCLWEITFVLGYCRDDERSFFFSDINICAAVKIIFIFIFLFFF